MKAILTKLSSDRHVLNRTEERVFHMGTKVGYPIRKFTVSFGTVLINVVAMLFIGAFAFIRGFWANPDS